MNDAEVATFLEQHRTIVLGTLGPDGTPHLAAMWYGLVDGRIYFETKAKSQKAVNLQRNTSVSCLIEDGDTYFALRGVSIDGTAHVIRNACDPEYSAACVSLYERYTGPFTEAKRGELEAMASKRVVVRIDPGRVRTWDHTKLGEAQTLPAGTTARYL